TARAFLDCRKSRIARWKRSRARRRKKRLRKAPLEQPRPRQAQPPPQQARKAPQAPNPPLAPPPRAKHPLPQRLLRKRHRRRSSCDGKWKKVNGKRKETSVCRISPFSIYHWPLNAIPERLHLRPRACRRCFRHPQGLRSRGEDEGSDQSL